MILETSEWRASKRTESILFVLWYSDLTCIAQEVLTGAPAPVLPFHRATRMISEGPSDSTSPVLCPQTASPHPRVNPDSSPCHLRSGPSFPPQHHLLSHLRCSSLDILRCVFPDIHLCSHLRTSALLTVLFGQNPFFLILASLPFSCSFSLILNVPS